MDKLQELIEELNNLPTGYISEKTIKGKKYYYYQYNDKGKTVSKYVKKSELAELSTQISRRQEIEKEIRLIEQSGRNMKKPSLRSLNLTGDLMMGDTVAAHFEDGKATFIDEKKCPLLIKRTGNLYDFLASRAIDRDRVHSRLLKKFLNLGNAEDVTVALYSYGATITDNYWFKAKGSKLKYKDISFEYDFYSDLVLKGTVGYVPRSPKHSPQLTLTGSYEKCWKLVDGTWYLFKQGSEDEIFSELFSSKLAAALGVPSAVYEYDEGYIRTKNIADVYNIEPISSIAGEDDSFGNVFNAIIGISEDIAVQYLQLILFDFIVYNVDRHNENCALFRDKITGEIVSLAPNYDNNIALLAATQNLVFNARYDGIARYITRFLNESAVASNLISKVQFLPVSEAQLKEIFDSIPIKRDEQTIAKYVLSRYAYVMDLISSKRK
ncbi:MAG: hypothetical protein MJ186_02285 [Clostridia bacterium]|nr:hypothetical protein [Clostridia bacterium]